LSLLSHSTRSARKVRERPVKCKISPGRNPGVPATASAVPRPGLAWRPVVTTNAEIGVELGTGAATVPGPTRQSASNI